MLRPTKKQINIKMPEALIEELKARAESENDTFTDLVIRFCKYGLGNESPATTHAALVPTQLDDHIASKLDNCIATQLAPLKEQFNELQECIDDRIANAIQKELDSVVGECSA
jgi:uncharacterized circularly permuted ATP-grasp superfamily protein